MQTWVKTAAVCAGLAAFSAAATTYYVDASRPNDSGDGLSWATAKRTIPAAATLAASGDDHEVVVTNGVYYVADGLIQLSRRNTVIRSVNGPAYTIIQGRGALGDDIAIRFTGDNCSNCVVRGFTIKDVRRSGWPSASIDIYDSGASWWLLGSRLEDCIISNCGNGASVRCADISQGSNMTLKNCIIQDSAAVHLAYYAAGTPVGPLGRVEGCRFIRLPGVVGLNYVSNCVFEACTYGSHGGACSIGSPNGEIYDSVFVRNYTTGGSSDGGAVYISSSTNVASTWVIRNCLFAANQAGRDGGALYFRNSGTGLLSAYIESCTFAANLAVSYGGAVNISGPISVMFVNSIAYSNLLTGYHHGVSDDLNIGAAQITNSCYRFVTPGFSATNCITAWPQFKHLGAGYGTNNTGTDFRLEKTSPCVNAGLDQPWMSEARDLAGNRRLCGTVDMGAYEYRVPRGTRVIFRGAP